MTNLGNRQGIWQWWGREGILKLVFVIVAMTWLWLLASSWAEAAEEKDEYSFNWLDPEKKIYVLQNRRYLKGAHIMLSANAGMGLSNAYRNSYALEPRLAFYLNETWGVEAVYNYTLSSPNSLDRQINQLITANFTPVARDVKSQMGVLLHWIPWYAKINVFNKIMYFDWSFCAGGGSIQVQMDRSTTKGSPDYVTTNYTAYYIGTGHQYHLDEHWKVRLDLTGSIYQSPIAPGYDTKDWYSNFVFSVGLGYRL